MPKTAPGHQHVLKPVHRQPRESIGLPKNQPAAAEIRPRHYRFPVVQSILDSPFKERFVKGIIGILGKQPNPNLGMVVDKTRTDIFAFFVDHIYQLAIFVRTVQGQHLVGKYPGMTMTGSPFSFFRNRCFSKIAHFLPFFF